MERAGDGAERWTGPISGLKVIDCATIFAGPLAATVLGDFGAEVVKVEHPRGDPLRAFGHGKDGHGLWWKVGGRNKKCVVLDLKSPDGAAAFKALAADADLVVENFRTGTLESWGLGWETLSALNPRLVMLRVTGFGQTGPYRRRPGFGTVAEAMSGFAHITGEADGPPTLPPFGLADGVAAYHGAFAAMFAIYERDVRGSGRGQYIDLSIYEPLFALLGAQATVFDQLGHVQTRTGNRSDNTVPRNAYRTADGRWVALSTSAPSIAMRVLGLTGGPEAAADPRFQSHDGRRQNGEEIDAMVSGWIGARPMEEVLAAFEEVQAAIGPVYDVAQFAADPQVEARGSVATVEDEDLGPLRMANVFPRLSRTPGRIRHAGPRLGQHSREVFSALAERGAIPADMAERLIAASREAAQGRADGEP